MRGPDVKMLLAMAGLTGLLSQAAMAQPAQPLPAQTAPVPLDAPSVPINNGLIDVKVYLIDPVNGFYRGTRFDQSGVVGRLTLGRQNFYGPWFDRVSSQVMDFTFTPDGIVGGPDSAVSGPVDEFAPVGFEETTPGGTFLKIGVGLLRKPDARPYDHYRVYDIADAGKRAMRTNGSSVTFTQEIAGSIRYAKTLRLVRGKPEMRIEHVLTNIGTKTIATSVYDHNFLTLSPGNADIAVTLPFTIVPDTVPDTSLVRIDGKTFAYQHPLTDKQSVSFHIAGFGNDSRDYDFSVADTRTGAGVRVTADQALIKLNIWSIRSVMAVEPYIDIDLPPGATKRWTYTYRYKAASQ